MSWCISARRRVHSVDEGGGINEHSATSANAQRDNYVKAKEMLIQSRQHASGSIFGHGDN
jgi:hypothetical protein